MVSWRYKARLLALVVALALAWPAGSTAGPALKKLGLSFPPGPREEALERLAQRGLAKGIPPRQLAGILDHFHRRRLPTASGPMLFEVLEEGALKGYPVQPLVAKLHEGLMKGVPPPLVTRALKRRLFALKKTDEIIGVLMKRGALNHRPRRARPFMVISSYLEAGLDSKSLFDLAGSEEVGSMRQMMHGSRAMWHLRLAGLPEREGLPLIRQALSQDLPPPGLNIMAQEVAKRLRSGVPPQDAVKQVNEELPRIKKFCERFRGRRGHMMRMHPRW